MGTEDFDHLNHLCVCVCVFNGIKFLAAGTYG